MKKFGFVLLVLLLTACAPFQTEEETPELFDYEGSYVGSPMSTKNILSLLPDYGLEWEEMRLETKEEPYGIHLYYKRADQTVAREAAREYSLYLLRLITNANFVSLHAGNDTYTYTREQWETWLGLPLENYASEKELKQALQMKLEEDPDREGLAESL